MKKFLIPLLFISFLIPSFSNAVVSVKGYYRSNGTYVAPHYRSDPDGIKSNNWSYPGNSNPYTGKTAGGSVSSYLNNYGSSGYTAPSYVPTYNTPSSYTSPTYTPTYTTPTYTSSYLSSSGSAYKKISGGYKSYGVVFCESGYYENGSYCRSAPKHATAYGGTDFYCDSGYKKRDNICVSSIKNSTYKNKSWVCNKGLVLNNSETVCVSPEKSCKEFQGANSHSVGDSCYSCADDLILNPATLSCENPKTSSLKANGCPKSGKGYNVYSGASCKK